MRGHPSACASRFRRLRRTSLLAAGATLLVGVVTHAEPPADEYRLKAAFLYRFPEFVAWPSSALEGRQTFDLCVLEPNPFGDALDALAEGESLDGRPVVVRHVKADGASGCQVLYLSDRFANRPALIRRLAQTPVLTVGESPHFLDEGGVIQLRLVSGRVRFDVDTDAAERAGLRLSAQLLRLAVTVRGRRS